MKRIALISLVLFVFMVIVSCAGKTSTGQKVFRARGTVESYEPGRVITLVRGATETQTTGTDYVAPDKNAPPEVFAYQITSDTELRGQVKAGIRVLIRYTETGSGPTAQRTALSIDPVWD